MKLKSKTYFIAIKWFVLSLISSVANDTLSKYINLHFYEITFFRFFFSLLVLLPFIISQNFSSILLPDNFSTHFLRGIFLFLATTSWTYGLSVASIVTATVIGFTIPLLVLVLSKIFLKETISWQRWIVVIMGLYGAIITINPFSAEFDLSTLVFIISALLFAGLDILNKRNVVEYSIIQMLLYPSWVISGLSFIPMLLYWQTPNGFEFFLLFILGINSNLVLFFLLKAFLLAEVSALAPFKYLELLLSTIVSYLIFQELPTKNIIWGGIIIILSIIFIVYYEKKESKKKL
jgi:S-adenosylmethionine uptake transporter